MKTRLSLAAAALCCASIVPMAAGADPWEVRREMREGARSVEIERREAAREIQRCQSRDCKMREVREGRREIKRERHEARDEVRRERSEDHNRPARYDRNYHQHNDGRYYASNRYNDGRYYGSNRYNDGRYYGSGNYGDRDAHYHPNGQYCRDGRHIAHLRDGYYRDNRRWYRDGRYWNEPDYVNRYYGGRDRRRGDGGDDDLMRGIVIGAAVVGVIAAIHDANDND